MTEFYLPKVGDIITVSTKHKSNLLGEEFKINTYVNVPVVAHDYPKTLSVQSNLTYPSGFIHRVSELYLPNIIRLTIVKQKHPNWKPQKYKVVEKPVVKDLTILGSTGNKYRVHIANGVALSCTCPGWHFRRHCRHLKEAENVYDQEKVRRT